MCVCCVYGYTHTALVVSWFGGQQETNTALQSVKERDRRPSSFQMVILSDRSTLNFRHLQFKIVTWSLRFWVYLLLLYICFLNSLAQFSGGIPTATIQVRRELVYDANFKHLNFGLGCGFFCLWSLHLLCNNCTFIFLYPLTPELQLVYEMQHQTPLFSGKKKLQWLEVENVGTASLTHTHSQTVKSPTRLLKGT